MEVKKTWNMVTEFIKKNKYISLILIVGLILMLIPQKGKESGEVSKEIITTQQTQAPQASVEQKLAEILATIDGAGKVKVMLTVSKGEETLYQTDTDLSAATDTSQHTTDTVIITDADKNQSGLVRQRVEPIYLGAIIVCQGADNPIIKLAITEAVAKITGLKSNHISVLKMK